MSYKKYLKAIEDDYESVRERHYIELCPFIEKKALAVKADITNTQHSLSPSGEYSNYKYNKIHESKKFNELHEFICDLEQHYKLYFYFTVENGIFRWLTPAH
jgi:hypothetical protein